MDRGQTPRGGLPLTRRELLATVPVALATRTGGATHAAHSPRIAAIVTEYRKASHGQGIVDRFLDGYGWEDSTIGRRLTSFRSTSISGPRATSARNERRGTRG